MAAQSLGEYGAQGGRLGGGVNVDQLTYSVREWITNLGPTVWMAIGALVVALLLFSRRTRRS